MAMNSEFKTFLDEMAKIKAPLPYDDMMKLLQKRLPSGGNSVKALADAFQEIMDNPKEQLNADGLHQVMLSLKSSPKKRLIYDAHVLKLPEKFWKEFRDQGWIKEHTYSATAAAPKGINLDMPKEHRQLKIPGSVTIEFTDLKEVIDSIKSEDRDNFDETSTEIEREEVIKLGIHDWLNAEVAKDLKKEIFDFVKKEPGFVDVDVELQNNSYKDGTCKAEFELTFFVDVDTNWESNLKDHISKITSLG